MRENLIIEVFSKYAKHITHVNHNQTFSRTFRIVVSVKYCFENKLQLLIK